MPTQWDTIDWAHPEEWWLVGIVVLGIIAILVWLIRLVFAGLGKQQDSLVLPLKEFRRVLLPSSAMLACPIDTVNFACRLAAPKVGSETSSVFLTYVIEVPRSLKVDAPMPEEEAAATAELTKAAEAVRACGLTPVMQVRKARTALDETLKAATENKTDVLVITPPQNKGADLSEEMQNAVQFAIHLAKRAPCEVVEARALRQ